MLVNSLFVDYMVDLLQVVQMNKHPLTVTFIAEADSITGELLWCEAALEPYSCKCISCMTCWYRSWTVHSLCVCVCVCVCVCTCLLYMNVCGWLVCKQISIVKHVWLTHCYWSLLYGTILCSGRLTVFMSHGFWLSDSSLLQHVFLISTKAVYLKLNAV